jgi:hypothetical protein
MDYGEGMGQLPKKIRGFNLLESVERSAGVGLQENMYSRIENVQLHRAIRPL